MLNILIILIERGARFMPAKQQEPPEPSLWLKWLVASVLGLILGGCCGMLATDARPEAGVGLFVGAGIGTTQWLVLRRRVPLALAWIPISMLGWGIGVATGLVLADAIMPPLLGWPVAGIVLGVWVGSAQWALLRRMVHRAYWWIPASGLSWGMGGLLSAAGTWWIVNKDADDTLAMAVMALTGLAAVLVVGVIPAALLARLLRHPVPLGPILPRSFEAIKAGTNIRSVLAHALLWVPVAAAYALLFTFFVLWLSTFAHTLLDKFAVSHHLPPVLFGRITNILILILLSTLACRWLVGPVLTSWWEKAGVPELYREAIFATDRLGIFRLLFPFPSAPATLLGYGLAYLLCFSSGVGLQIALVQSNLALFEDLIGGAERNFALGLLDTGDLVEFQVLSAIFLIGLVWGAMTIVRMVTSPRSRELAQAKGVESGPDLLSDRTSSPEVLALGAVVLLETAFLLFESPITALVLVVAAVAVAAGGLWQKKAIYTISLAFLLGLTLVHVAGDAPPYARSGFGKLFYPVATTLPLAYFLSPRPWAAYVWFERAQSGVEGSPGPLKMLSLEATSAMVCGVLSLAWGNLCCVSPFALLGLVLGYLSIRQLSRSPGQVGAKMAWLGVFLSLLGLGSPFLLDVF
jgi:hypothetical protein